MSLADCALLAALTAGLDAHPFAPVVNIGGLVINRAQARQEEARLLRLRLAQRRAA